MPSKQGGPMIEISVNISAPVTKVWERWTDIKVVKDWAFASDDWAAEGVENDVMVGGSFKARNYAKDGSMEFMLTWTYDHVDPQRHLAYTMEDGRKVEVRFLETGDGTRLEQSFEPEPENSEDIQRDGWQAYLDNFKKFVESEQC